MKLLIFLLRNFSFSFVKLCRDKINPTHALSELIDNCTDGICIIEVMIALSLPNILDPFFNRCQSVFCSSFVISGLINEGIRPLQLKAELIDLFFFWIDFWLKLGYHWALKISLVLKLSNDFRWLLVEGVGHRCQVSNGMLHKSLIDFALIDYQILSNSLVPQIRYKFFDVFLGFKSLHPHIND